MRSAARSMLRSGCWMLDAGCWLLDAGCWMLDAGCASRVIHGCRLVLSNRLTYFAPRNAFAVHVHVADRLLRRRRFGGRIGPGMHRFQLARQVLLAAQVALHFAAGRDRQRRLSDQHDGVRIELVLLDDRPADGADDVVHIRTAELAVELVDDDELFVAVLGFDGERGARQHGRVGLLGRLLDVLRVVVAGADDDHILEPAGDEQLAVAEEAEVAAAQKFSIAACDAGAEHLLGFLGPVPISLGDRRALDEDLADFILIAFGGGFGADDDDGVAGHGRAAADKPLRHLGRFAAGLDDVVLGERGAVDGEDAGLLIVIRAGGQQRRLGQAVTGIKRIHAEAGAAEGVGEVLERLGADRLGAAERETPAAQVELGALLGRGAADAVFVGEVGRAADRGAIVVNGLQPAHGTLQKRGRRHQHAAPAHVQRREDAADEAHVMISGQPEDTGRRLQVFFRLADAERLADAFEVVEQVAVRDHHALGVARGAGRVLQEGEVAVDQRRRLPHVGKFGVEFVRGNPFIHGGVGRQERGIERGERLRGGEGDVGIAVERDPLQAWHRPFWFWIGGGDCDDAGVQAAEECGDEFDAGRIDQQRAVARAEFELQPGSDNAGQAVEFGERDLRQAVAVVEELEGHAVGVVADLVAQQFQHGPTR